MPHTDASRAGWSARLFRCTWVGIAPFSLLIAARSVGLSPSDVSGWTGLVALLIANGALLALPAFLPLPRGMRRAILLAAAAAAVFTLAYMARYGAAPGPAVLASLADTGARELMDVLPAVLAAHPVGIAAYCALALWIAFLPQPPALRRGARLALLNLAIWSCNGLLAAWAYWPQGYARLIPAGAEYAVFPGNLLLSAWNAWRHAPDEADERARAEFRFDARAEAPHPLRVVLVIGESASAARWQLGGYSRPTNPSLATMPDLIYFPAARADATTTHDALPYILGRSAPPDPRRSLREKSIVSAFAEAGFATTWISNQDRYRASLEADAEIYVNPDWSSHNGRYDADLLPAVAARLRQSGSQFIVVHMLGSHFPYRNRVPPEARHFGLAPGAGPLEDYDDSIRVTDQFLARLIAMLRAADEIPTALLYVSDHGQDLERAAAGDLSQGMPGDSASLRDIPLLVWLSPAYRRMRPDVTPLLVAATRCTAHQFQVFPTLIWLGRIRLREAGPALAGPHCGAREEAGAAETRR